MLIAYDGSPAARRALQHAAVAVGGGGRVIVINVIPAQSVSARLETVTDAERVRQQRLLGESWTKLARRGVEAQLIAAAGDPLMEILAAADERDVDIVVVGRSESRWRHLLHGSVSSGLVRKATRDVLVGH